METRYWLKVYWSFILFVGIFLSSCNQYDRKVEGDIEQLCRATISIPVHQMQRFEGLCDSASLINTSGEFRMIVYIDSTECSPCTLKYLYDWEPILDSLISYPKYRESIFIFAPSKSECPKVERELNQKNFKYPVYLDTCNAFVKGNRSIPANRMMHTFLIDAKDSVVLVGNPLTNEKVKALLFNFFNNK